MFKICRVLNKDNNDNIFPFKLDLELVNFEGYPFVELPNDGKTYESIEEYPFYREKILNLPELKQSILKIIENLRKTPFAITIMDINELQGNYYLDLQDSTILKLLVLIKKAEIIGQASDEFVNAETGIPEYKTFSIQAIQQVQAEVISKDDFLKLKANQVKNAQSLEDLQTIEQELNL